MFPILFQWGPITLHTYGLMVAVGFLCALRVARGQFALRGLPEESLDKIVLSLMIGGILGARLLYFAVDNFRDLRVDPLSFLRIWEGGLVFYGGVIVGLVALIFYARYYNVPFLILTDAFAVPLLLGHSIGRLGCLAAGCCYGKPTTLPWGIVFKHPASLAPRFESLHPTQLYESLGYFFLFLVGWFISRKTTRLGWSTGFYLVAAGAFRFSIEFLRGDDRGLYRFGLSPSQLVAAAMIVVGVGLFLYEKTKKT